MTLQSIALPFVGMAAAILLVYGAIIPTVEYFRGTPVDAVGLRSVDHEAEAHLSRSWDAVERCYDTFGVHTGSRNSAVVLRLQIDEAGTVMRVDVLQAPPRSEALTRCIGNEVRTWQFSTGIDVRAAAVRIDPAQRVYTGT